MTTAKLKEDKTLTGEEYKVLHEVEQKIKDLAVDKHQKKEEEEIRRPDDANQNSKEQVSSVNTEETAAQRRQRMIRLHLLLLEHASYCNSSECSSSHCAKRKQELEHISSCREGFKGGCLDCTEMLNMIRIHAMSCETSHCKVPRCELAKQRMRQRRSEQSKTENPTTTAVAQTTAIVKEDDTVMKNQRANCHSNRLVTKGSDAAFQGIQDKIQEIDAMLSSSDEERETFYAFMLWSLSDEANLNPKKFAKHASGMAKLLIAGKISIQNLIMKRRQTLTKFENSIKDFEYRESMQILYSGLNFSSPEDKDKFQQQLKKAVFSRLRKKSPMYMIFFDSFQQIFPKWQNSSKVCLDDNCIFAVTSREEFGKLCSNMLKDKIGDPEMALNEQAKKSEKVNHKYYMHPTARKEYFENGFAYAHIRLKSILTLYEESHRCWSCNRLHGKGVETKALICAGCKCAVYCSKECQVKDLKDGHHKQYCGTIDKLWSLYQCKRKRVGRALQKGRIFTKPVIINGIEKECFLRPCEYIDYHVISSSQNVEDRLASMDIFYENIARLSCGGKHVLFGNDIISSRLEEELIKGYEVVEFEPESLTKDDRMSMLIAARLLQYKESDLTALDLGCNDISVDRFIALYILLNRQSSLKFECFDKFLNEAKLLKELKKKSESNFRDLMEALKSISSIVDNL
ncbi:hypothetical protein CTEN210_04319 [Chaetoceros tenuissimus]|uniref:histone acetyltransferase n=1 Tax=Chaetoceros tenuissimus TaxID=426638 RepID=A0AAD3CKZ3_9STRA|nr:hypothetical protein CTEN210_04319 [Chaetoceros tenuissimus]